MHRIVVLLLSLPLVLSPVVSAQIYKWVDANGKVHYGDKPRDAAQASAAQPVELREGYQPTARTAQEQAAYDEEQRRIQLRDAMRRSEEQQAQTEAESRRREEIAKVCASYNEAIEKLSAVRVEDNVRTFTYIEGEDGKSVSSNRQSEIVEELKAKRAAAGCT